MPELTDDDLLAGVRAYWESHDPVPEGMTARLQAVAALAASDTDLDLELMMLVERTDELAGARGASTTAYTLRFAHDGVDLLLRVSGDGTSSRIDGWVVPPSSVTVSVLRDTEVLATPGRRRHRPLRGPRPEPRDAAAPARAGRRQHLVHDTRLRDLRTDGTDPAPWTPQRPQAARPRAHHATA